MSDEKRVWNAEQYGYDVEGPCWNCGHLTAYFEDEDGTPRDIRPIEAGPDWLTDDQAERLVTTALWGMHYDPDAAQFARKLVAEMRRIRQRPDTDGDINIGMGSGDNESDAIADRLAFRRATRPTD